MIAPDLTTEIIGYRQWRITSDLLLRAAAHRGQASWASGVNEAVCHRQNIDRLLQGSLLPPDFRPAPAPCGDTPGEDCECGFYALHGPGDLWYGRAVSSMSLMVAMAGSVETDPLVSGVIVGWGKVQVHHQGFRCQFARVAALAIPAPKRDAVVVRAAAAEYGVPCVPLNELPKIAAEFGASVPEEMRPARPEAKPDYSLFGSYHVAGPIGGGWMQSPPPPPPPPPPSPSRPRFGLPLKRSNRQRPHEGKQRAPKQQRGKPWGAW